MRLSGVRSRLQIAGKASRFGVQIVFRVPGFGFRRKGFRVSGFGFRIEGIGFRFERF